MTQGTSRGSRLRGLAAVFRPTDLLILAVSGYFLVILDGILKAVIPGARGSTVAEYVISVGLAVAFAVVILCVAPISAGRLATPIGHVREALIRGAHGDLSVRVPVDPSSDLRPLLEEVNLFLSNFREAVEKDRKHLSAAAQALQKMRIEVPPQYVQELNKALAELEQVTGSYHLQEGQSREPTGEWVRGATPSGTRA